MTPAPGIHYPKSLECSVGGSTPYSHPQSGLSPDSSPWNPLLLKKIKVYFIYMSVLLAYMCVPHGCLASQNLEGTASDPLEQV